MKWLEHLRRSLAGESAPDVGILLRVIEHLPDAMTLSESVRDSGGRATDMRLLYMNRKAREGQPDPENAIGGLCSLLWPDMVRNGSFDACMRVLDSGVPEDGEFLWTDPATYRPAGYDWRAVRVGSDILLWVLRDISDRLRREQAVADVYESIVQSLAAATMARDLGDNRLAAEQVDRALAVAKRLTTRELAPLTAPSGPAIPPTVSRRPELSKAGTPVRVLVCDDQAPLRMMLRLALESRDRFRVVGEATNGREAAELAAELQPDLVLLDLTMPVLSGVEAIPLVRDAAPETTVVVMSSLLGDAVADEIQALGAAGYIEKGTPVADILTRLETILWVPPSTPGRTDSD